MVLVSLHCEQSDAHDNTPNIQHACYYLAYTRKNTEARLRITCAAIKTNFL